mmetsp:Transcript_10033/g.22489  ORF Transcript_10033/g.22489 Transcript_10033/m.22489 type:complete len:463 (+) Transcript_10033:96-1484(+)
MPRRHALRRDGTDDLNRDGWGEIFAKTKMCKSHLSGQCHRGQACNFAHGQEELRPLPNLRRTKMCREICKMGFCSKGRNCGFAHSLAEMRPKAALPLLVMPSKQDPPPALEGSGSSEPGRLPNWLPAACPEKPSNPLQDKGFSVEDPLQEKGFSVEDPLQDGGFSVVMGRLPDWIPSPVEGQLPPEPTTCSKLVKGLEQETALSATATATAMKEMASLQIRAAGPVCRLPGTSAEEPKDPYYLSNSKICRAFALQGFCQRGTRCFFAHCLSLQEVQRSPAITSLLIEQEQSNGPYQEEELPGASRGSLESIPPSGKLTGLATSSVELRHCRASAAAMLAQAKTAKVGDGIWSCKTTARASGESRLDEPRETGWCRPGSIEFKASDVLRIRALTASDGPAALDEEDSASESWSEDGPLELQVQNTFLAALPRRPPGRRALSAPLPCPSGSPTRLARSSRHVSH